MNRALLMLAAAGTLAASSALAAPPGSGSASVQDATATPITTDEGLATLATDAPSELALPVVDAMTPDLLAMRSGLVYVARPRMHPRVVYGSIRYEPRYPHPSYPPPPAPAQQASSAKSGSSGPKGYAQLHGGIYRPDANAVTDASFGVRFGTSPSPAVQLGIATDWMHRAENSSNLVASGTLPGGGTVERRVDLSNASSDLVPISAFIQLTPIPVGPFQPFIGAGGGYEALFVNATDFATGNKYNATFDGWGWQAWAGLGIPLGGPVKIVGEVFGNWATLDRNVDDPAAGQSVREVVRVDGVGTRAGLSFSF
jgi:hypothetical protein